MGSIRLPDLSQVPERFHARLIHEIELGMRSYPDFCRFWLGFTPHEKQLALVNDAAITVMSCGSGVGKSTGATSVMLWEAWRRPGFPVGAFAPTNAQVKLLAQDCAQHIARGGGKLALFLDHKPTKDDPYLGFTHGSRITFLNTAYGADHSRGYEFGLAFMDEAALDKADTFGVVQTRVRLRPGRVVLLSTPRGKGGWFFEQAVLAQEEELRAQAEERLPIRRFIKASSFDNPHYPREILEMRRQTMSRREFEQEIMGEFVDLGGATFKQDDLDRVFDARWEPETAPRRSGLYFHGWDLGKKGSYLVWTTIAGDRQDGVEGDFRGIVQEDRMGERWSRIFAMIGEHERMWGTGSSRSESIYDHTGIGQAGEDFVDVGAQEFDFTGKSRGELLLRFTQAVETPNRLRFPRHWSRLYTQMQLHTPKEDAPGHTWDHLDSAALSYWLAHERLTVGGGFAVG